MTLETDGAAVSYTKAAALMICWKHEGKTQRTFKDQRDKLGDEFEAYNFGVEKFEIEPVTPYRALFQRLYKFLEHDDRETLLVVYYGGHGEKNADNQLVWLRDEPKSSRDIRGTPQVNWSALQTLFLHECASPVLFLLDCCYAGASVHREQSSSTVVALAATGFHDVAPVRGKDSFTTFLTKALMQERENERDVNVPYLKTLISSMLNNPDMLDLRGTSRRVTPDYFPFSNSTITLRVLQVREDHRCLAVKPGPEVPPSQSHLHDQSHNPSSSTVCSYPDDMQPTLAASNLSIPVLTGLDVPPSQSHLHDQSHNPSSSIVCPYPDDMQPILAVSSLPTPMLTISPPNKEHTALNNDLFPELRLQRCNPPQVFDDARSYYSLHRTSTHSFRMRSLNDFIQGSRPPSPCRNKYSYPRLKENNIRLLRIYPAQALKESLFCYIEELDILQDPGTARHRYTALSWRLDTAPQDYSRQTSLRPDPGWSDEIHVTEGPFSSSLKVHPSLLQALRQLRHHKETVVLWVDQLCINWSDKEEAQIQGQLIPGIFQRASDVAVWLGEGNEDSNTAIQFIPDLLNLNLVDSLVREENMPIKWQALINLMKRPYFSRRWVFLELILAKRAVLYCGSETVRWDDFADAVVILGSRYDEVRLGMGAALSLDQNSKLDSLVDPRSLAAYSIVEASRQHFRRQGDGSSMATCNLETLVSRLPALQSWHPAAVIYALLPLATDHEIWMYAESESPQEVFQQFIMHCVQTSKSLDIICRPWAPRTDTGIGRKTQYGTYPKHEKLPSWIRQVNHLPFGEGSRTGRKNGDLFVGLPNRPYYAAAGGSIATPIFGKASESGKRELDCSMTVSGFVVGEIQDVKGRSQDGTLPFDWVQMFEWQASSSDENNNANVVPDHLWRTLVADRGPGGTSAPLWYYQACRHWLLEYSDDDITTTLIRGRQHSSMALEFIQRVRSVIWNRTLFTTTDLKGRTLFGLGPPEASKTHKICVLHGCSVPVVLDQVKDHWILVGECFVYGIMDGEAIQMNGYTTNTQEFLLL